MTDATPFLPGLSLVAGKPLTASFDAGPMSSDGGLIVLREVALRLGLADVIAGPLPDTRDPTRVLHTYADMVTARMMAIAAGYEDCDDLDGLRGDPALKLACGRAPESGADLMSQPTLSRLENLAERRTLMQIGLGFIDLFCKSWARPPGRIVLDIDDTDDPVHGQQELALFNTHAGGHCFMPMLIFEATSGKPIMAMMRPGKRPSGKEVAAILHAVIARTPADVSRLSDAGRQTAEELAGDSGNRREILQSLLARIVIADDEITLVLSRVGWLEPLGRAAGRDDREVEPPTLRLPVRFTKRRVEQKIILGGADTRPPQHDDVLIRAVARACSWLDALKQQRYRDLTEIARTERVPRTYVHALIPLAFLAPSIVTAILAGRQPADLTLEHLIKRADLSPDWAVQRRQLGFDA